MSLPLILIYRAYLNILLITSPAKLFSTIIKADAYHGILVEWTNSLIDDQYKTVLEVGCGPGVLACHLAARGHNVTGIDLSDSMIQRAKQLSAQQKLAVKFQRADARETGLPGASFDTILGASIVNVVKDPLFIIKEAWRLLKPHGCVSFLFPTKTMTSRDIYRYATKNNYSAFSTAVLMTWASKARKMQPQSLTESLNLAGFNKHQLQTIMGGMVAAITAHKEASV